MGLKRSLTALLVSTLILFGVVGCGDNQKNTEEKAPTSPVTGEKTIDFKVIEPEEAPEEIQGLLQGNRTKETMKAIIRRDGVYLLVTRGEMPTGGYAVTIDSIYKEDGLATARVVYKNPEPDDVVTQGITYPAVIAKVERVKGVHGIAFELLDRDRLSKKTN